MFFSFFRSFLFSYSRSFSVLQIAKMPANSLFLVGSSSTFVVLLRISFFGDSWSISSASLLSFWGGQISGAAFGESQMEQSLLHLIQEQKSAMSKTKISKALTCFFTRFRFHTGDYSRPISVDF